MTRTAKGYELANKLAPIIPDTANHDEVVAILSKICRHQAKLHRLHERACSDPTYGELDARVEALAEKNVLSHWNRFLEITNNDPEKFKILFNGDPRGPSIKITVPDQYKWIVDCFGGEGVCVP